VEFGSPGTDALGRAGVTGEVDTQFAARFGAAILISLIDAAAAAVGIGPVIRVAPGERLSVMVARDVSFGQVYALAHR
jgi:type IV secretion system protein VirB10